MAAEGKKASHKVVAAKFSKRDFEVSTDEAVERELKRIRPQFNFTDADLRRLRQPRRRRVA
jgi:hypothetical protein